MEKRIFIIAANELRVLIRERTFLLLLSVFLLMTLFSTYIGWSTKTTILGIYHASLITLQHSGVTHLPPNPFINIPALSIFRNMIIYIFLIGSLLAIVIGHRAFIRERKSGVTLLLFSKPIDRKTYILGKIIGIVTALSLILFITYFISLLSTIFIPNQQLSLLEILKLFSFYVLSLLYMLIFAMLGFLFAILLPTESLALLVPIIIWVAVTFIFPELTTGQNPVALLNPTNISQTTVQGSFFSTMQTILFPISIEQHYTGIAQPLLETQKQFNTLNISDVLIQNSKPFLSLVFYFFLSLLASFYAMNKYSASNDKIYE